MEEQTEKIEQKETKEEIYKLAEVATGYQRVILTPEGEEITLDEAIIHLLNEVSKVKKLLG